MNIKELVSDICTLLRESEYPRIPFDYIMPGVIILHIRIPPTVPPHIKARYPDIRDQVRAAPSIERVVVSTELRGRGIFRSLVEALLDLDFVDCLCITNVHTESFRQYFLKNDEWQELVFPQNPCTVIAPRNFYKMAKVREKKQIDNRSSTLA